MSTSSPAKRRRNDEDAEKNGTYRLPIEKSIELAMNHEKSVMSVVMDAAGARMSTGSADESVTMTDFHGYASSGRPFRSFEPIAGHPVFDLAYSPSGDRLLVCTGDARCKVFDRDGVEKITFRKGDPYIYDMRKTTGHVAGATACAWVDSKRAATSSRDSTVRIFDLIGGKSHWSGELENSTVIRHSDRAGHRIGVSSMATSRQFIASACDDGCIQLWDHSRAKYTRPHIRVDGAHKPARNGAGICSVAFDSNETFLASRGHDGCLRVWDLRRIKTPIHAVNGLFTASAGAGCAFGPGGKTVATVTGVGTSRTKRTVGGKLLIFDHRRDNPAPIGMTSIVGDESGVAICWHHTLNQIAIGTSSGHVHVHYSRSYSTKGALRVASTTSSKKRRVGAVSTDANVVGRILTPNALPMYRDAPSKKEALRKRRRDPQATKRPHLPRREEQYERYMSKNFNYTSEVEKERRASKYLDKDPRAELLKYAASASANKEFTSAWSTSQPKPILANRTVEQEAIDLKKSEEEYLKKF